MRIYRLMMIILFCLFLISNISIGEAMSYREEAVYEEMLNNQGLSENNLWNSQENDYPKGGEEEAKPNIAETIQVQKKELPKITYQEAKEKPKQKISSETATPMVRAPSNDISTPLEVEVEWVDGEGVDGQTLFPIPEAAPPNQEEVSKAVSKKSNPPTKSTNQEKKNRKFIGKILPNNRRNSKRTYKNTLNKKRKNKLKVLNNKRIDKKFIYFINEKIQCALFILISYGLYLVYLQNKSKYLFYK